MDALIWVGAAISLAGLGGLMACILYVMRARREGLSDEDLRVRLRKAVVWNLAALMTSAFGLMIVVVGVMLG